MAVRLPDWDNLMIAVEMEYYRCVYDWAFQMIT